jgi:hypothetical protein
MPRWIGVFLFNFGNLLACRINSLKSDETFMTKQFAGKLRTIRGRKYRVLIETGPDITTEWGVPAGIQTARNGGTTQIP